MTKRASAEAVSVHLGNTITEWNERVEYREMTTLRGRYDGDAWT